MPSIAYHDRYHDIQYALRRETRPASRMEAQRLLLEDTRMYHLNSMIVDQRALDRDRDLARRQLIVQAKGSKVLMTSRFRQALGGALIFIGKRITPQFAQGEPKFNG